MEIRPFLYVNQIAECGSMTKAAAALFITQPALSNYISKLEEELGVRLFDRSVTPLRLTYAGERYLAYTRRILMQVGDLEREMRDISRNQRGRIRLGFPGERMICMLPVFCLPFRKNTRGFGSRRRMAQRSSWFAPCGKAMWILSFCRCGRNTEASRIRRSRRRS